jgi:hypothetical protein
MCYQSIRTAHVQAWKNGPRATSIEESVTLLKAYIFFILILLKKIYSWENLFYIWTQSSVLGLIVP